MGLREGSEAGVMDFNWFAVIFVGLLPGAIIGMGIAIVAEHIKRKGGAK